MCISYIGGRCLLRRALGHWRRGVGWCKLLRTLESKAIAIRARRQREAANCMTVDSSQRGLAQRAASAAGGPLIAPELPSDGSGGSEVSPQAASPLPGMGAVLSNAEHADGSGNKENLDGGSKPAQVRRRRRHAPRRRKATRRGRSVFKVTSHPTKASIESVSRAHSKLPPFLPVPNDVTSSANSATTRARPVLRDAVGDSSEVVSAQLGPRVRLGAGCTAGVSRAGKHIRRKRGSSGVVPLATAAAGAVCDETANVYREDCGTGRLTLSENVLHTHACSHSVHGHKQPDVVDDALERPAPAAPSMPGAPRQHRGCATCARRSLAAWKAAQARAIAHNRYELLQRHRKRGGLVHCTADVETERHTLQRLQWVEYEPPVRQHELVAHGPATPGNAGDAIKALATTSVGGVVAAGPSAAAAVARQFVHSVAASGLELGRTGVLVCQPRGRPFLSSLSAASFTLALRTLATWRLHANELRFRRGRVEYLTQQQRRAALERVVASWARSAAAVSRRRIQAEKGASSSNNNSATVSVMDKVCV